MVLKTGPDEAACDLHVHTACSDGSASVEYVLDYAKRTGLRYIAVTDHDTFAGSRKARAAAGPGGPEVIPGAEISARDDKRGRNVHMLCYCPKDEDGLQRFMDDTLKRRRQQKLQMAWKISRLYPGFTVEAVEQQALESESIYECHIMQVLCDLGYTNTAIGPLMEELISSRGSCYVPNSYPSAREAAEAIRDAGGIAVVAHPEQFDSFALVEELAQSGLIQGVEVWHPRNSEAARTRLRQLARQYDLAETGGSDYHGQYAKTPTPLAKCTCTPQQAEKLKDRAGYGRKRTDRGKII